MDQMPSSTNGKKRPQERSGTLYGRNILEGWQQDQPDNYFANDLGFQRSLEFLWGTETYQKHALGLYRFGGVLATKVDKAVREANLTENLPRLNRYDELGRRIEKVIFHPSHHEAGRQIYGSGLLSVNQQPGNNLLSLAHFYLSSQNGEAGHNCPVACTAGLIKVLQAIGDEKLREQYLPGLLNSDYDSNLRGAQYLTEIQGGSDVGANSTTARRLGASDRHWHLNGEKWFCSNVTADLTLVTARVAGQGEGTEGLGLFLLPRRLEDGQLNSFYIHQLKDKIGTRSMATGEVEFRDAFAYQVGPLEQGFKNVMMYVISTSRIYNAVAVAGNARRAYIVARSYAQNRSAFGRTIIHFPLVQDILANMRADGAALFSGTLQIIKLMDDVELGRPNSRSEGFLRTAINLNKYRSSVLAHQVIMKGIEILGGNGAVENFSVLPRLLRDNVVFENWEGTHNVLLAQVQRDFRRHGLAKPFFDAIRSLLNQLNKTEFKEEALGELDQIKRELDEILAMDELTGAIFFRPLMDRLTDLYYAACLAIEGEWGEREKLDRTKMRLATLFFARHVAGRQPKDIAYYDDKVSRLCQ